MIFPKYLAWITFMVCATLAAVEADKVWEKGYFKDKNVFELSGEEAMGKVKTGLCNYNVVDGPESGFSKPTVVYVRQEPRGLDGKGMEQLKKTCPGHTGEKPFEATWGKKTCCSIEMLEQTEVILNFIAACLKNCPVCVYNVRAIICNISCNPKQALGSRVNNDDKDAPKGAKELIQAMDIDVIVRDEEAEQAHASCDNVKPGEGKLPPPYTGYDGPPIEMPKGGASLAAAAGQKPMHIACASYGSKCVNYKDMDGSTMNILGTKYHLHLVKDKYKLEGNKGSQLGPEITTTDPVKLAKCNEQTPNGDKPCEPDQCKP